MTKTIKIKVIDLVEVALYSIDVGGEQSRQFADEIRQLKKAIRILRKSL